MAGETFTIVLRGGAIRPDARLGVFSSLDGWRVRVPCRYVEGADEWRVELDRPPAGTAVEFKFHCDGAWEALNGNRLASPADIAAGERIETMTGNQSDLFPTRDDIIVTNPLPARRHFAPKLDEGAVYDYVIIGSGMGGGVLAHELTRMAAAKGGRMPQVLVLEAGGYLFSTHVGNMPRMQSTGAEANRTVWGLWYQYRSERYRTNSARMQVAEAFCLGGKSVFWGALIPPMIRREFESWPRDVHDELRTQWYDEATDLMHATPPALSDYRRTVKELLRTQLKRFRQHEVQVAAESSVAHRLGIPSGIFSTAALLMEDRLRDGWNRYLHVNLNHEVVGFEWDRSSGTPRVAAVRARDLIAGKDRDFRLADGGRVIMAAGTVGSAVLARRAQIGNEWVGKGITDHPTYVWKFTLPSDAPGYAAHDSVKILLRGSVGSMPINVVVEMGIGLNQYRVDEDAVPAAADVSRMDCEIVFFPSVPLLDGNTVELDPVTGRPVLTMKPVEIPGYLAAVREIGSRIIQIMGGDPAASEPFDADLGAVGHEVGTLRMSEDPGMGVVDPDLKVWGHDNLYVCDLSVFPTSPAANPSLTLTALAMRLADHLSL
ncbi:GMC oxidoreductase [Nonomuraea guangzhouensis]|uniref:GMC oxidoreductase n=1 Tax=Nonomuraea guangzhouensis TaxID=1291555 RepID=A0ABW4GZ26_9ACTN|nr:GMC oxidoreductase [Nonomuraea guangzhouensis]